jgi:hypothetical protein
MNMPKIMIRKAIMRRGATVSEAGVAAGIEPIVPDAALMRRLRVG